MLNDAVKDWTGLIKVIESEVVNMNYEDKLVVM